MTSRFSNPSLTMDSRDIAFALIAIIIVATIAIVWIRSIDDDDDDWPSPWGV